MKLFNRKKEFTSTSPTYGLGLLNKNSSDTGEKIEEKEIDTGTLLNKEGYHKGINLNKEITFKKKKKVSIDDESKPKSVKLLGIDIGTYETKLVEGRYKNDKLVISKLSKFKSPKDMFQEGNLLNQDVLVLTMKNQLSETGIKTKNAAISTAASTIINREIIVPYVEDEEELRTLVSYEVQQFLCINLNNYAIQFMIIDDFIVNEVRKLKLFTIIYPKAIITSYKELCRKLLLNPYALDISNNAVRKIHRISNQYNGDIIEKKKPVLYMDMGYENINLTIVCKGRIEFMRTLPIGGSDIDNFIRESLNIKLDKAEEFKKEKISLISMEENEVNDGVLDILSGWIMDLNRILQFYTNKSEGKKVAKIYITGGTSKLRGMEEYIQDKTGILTEKIRTIDSVEFDKNIDVVTVEEYMSAIGALIRL